MSQNWPTSGIHVVRPCSAKNERSFNYDKLLIHRIYPRNPNCILLTPERLVCPKQTPKQIISQTQWKKFELSVNSPSLISSFRNVLLDPFIVWTESDSELVVDDRNRGQIVRLLSRLREHLEDIEMPDLADLNDSMEGLCLWDFLSVRGTGEARSGQPSGGAVYACDICS